MKRKPLLATVSIFATTLTLAGCASQPGTPTQANEGNPTNQVTNATNVSNTSNSSSTVSNSSPGNQSTTNNTSEGPVTPGKPTSLNVVKTDKLSLTNVGSPLGQGTFAPESGPDFLNQQEGFIGTPNGLRYTSNGGQTWHTIPSPKGTIVDLNFTTPSTGWVVTRTGSMKPGSSQTFTIYRTTNAGGRWVKQWSATAKEDMTGARLFDFGAKGRLALVADQLLRQTHDSSWSAVPMPVSGTVVDADFITAETGWAVVEQKHKATLPNHADTSTLVVLRTTDGGLDWHTELKTAAFLGDGATIEFGSASDGLMLYKDTGTMNTTVYRTTNGGASWAKSVPAKLSGRLFAGRPVFNADGSVWLPLSAGAGPFASSVLESDDVGKTWHTVSQHGEWRSLMLGKRFGGTSYLIAGLSQGYAFLKTTNNGKSWTQILPGVAPTKSISFVSSTVGYALGTEANSDAILKTTDGGSTWTTVGVLPEGTQAYDIAFASDNVGYVTIAPTKTNSTLGNTVIMETQDGGKTWTLAPFGGLPKSVLDGISKSQNIVEPVYFHPPSQWNGNDWVLGTTGYPTLYTISAGVGSSTVDATYSDPPGAIEAYSFLSRTDGWMSVLKTTKSGSSNGQSLIQTFDSTQKQWIPKWTLPTGWSIEGMYRLNAEDAWLLVQKPWTSMHPTLAIYRTTDGGKSWTRYDEANGPDLYAPSTTGSPAFPIDFVNASDGWLLTQQGLLKTTDGGVTWKPTS